MYVLVNRSGFYSIFYYSNIYIHTKVIYTNKINNLRFIKIILSYPLYMYCTLHIVTKDRIL